MKKIFEYYLANVPHKGKRHTVRLILDTFPYQQVKSFYGPLMRVNRQDKTNIYALCGEYGNVVSDHVKKLKQGDVFIDIGANYGLFSLMAAKQVGRDGSVFSFEPNPAIYRYFLENIMLNSHKNIVPFHCAVSKDEGLTGLTFQPRHSGKSHLSGDGDFTIPALNPANWPFLTEKIGQRDVHIKIDVEGYEAEILKALFKAPWFKNIRSIIVEIDEKNLGIFKFASKEDIYAPLEKEGFTPTICGKYNTHYDEIFIRR